MSTQIQWTDETWNPIRGCSRVSAGCQSCYAEAIAARFSGPGLPYEGLARRRSNGKAQWTGEVRVIESHMNDPLKWRKPRRIFVNSMSDLFHENVSDADLVRIFDVMRRCTWRGGQNEGRIGGSGHTFQILTKRPRRMLDFCARLYWERNALRLSDVPVRNPFTAHADQIWLGVSTENQETADERIPLLLETPAAVRFISAEPLLGPIDLTNVSADVDDEAWRDVLRGRFLTRYSDDEHEPETPRIGWVIVGGESGRGARECDLGWIRNLVAQCVNANVAVFVKQLGANPVDPWVDTGALVNDREPVRPKFRDSHGGDLSEWPEDLRIREFPTASPLAQAAVQSSAPLSTDHTT